MVMKPKANSPGRNECLRTGKHVWSSTAGGYWCMRCHLTIKDEAIQAQRKLGINDPLDMLLVRLAPDAEQWIHDLHAWSRSNNELE